MLKVADCKDIHASIFDEYKQFLDRIYSINSSSRYINLTFERLYKTLMDGTKFRGYDKHLRLFIIPADTSHCVSSVTEDL